MPSGAGHRGVKVWRLAFARLTVFLAVVAFAAFSRCYQGTVLAVWRENTQALYISEMLPS
jgi:hypothetical protein